MSNFLSIIAIVISGCSFIFVVWKTNKIEKRQLEIEEAREKDRVSNKKQALLSAVFEKHPIQSVNMKKHALKDVIVIRNKGLCDARDVTILLDNKPLLEHAGIRKGQPEFKEINADSSIAYDLDINSRGGVRPREYDISWQDEAGGSRKTGKLHFEGNS